MYKSHVISVQTFSANETESPIVPQCFSALCNKDLQVLAGDKL